MPGASIISRVAALGRVMIMVGKGRFVLIVGRGIGQEHAFDMNDPMRRIDRPKLGRQIECALAAAHRGPIAAYGAAGARIAVAMGHLPAVRTRHPERQQRRVGVVGKDAGGRCGKSSGDNGLGLAVQGDGHTGHGVSFA